MIQRTPLSPLDAAWDPTLQTEDGDEYCWTPLQLAARGGDLAKMGEIIRTNPSVVNDPPQGYYGQSALQAACMHGHEQAVQMLVDAGANVHFCGGNNFQRNALQIACGYGSEKIVDILLKSGADVDAMSQSSVGAPVQAYGPSNPSFVVTRYNGRTALQAAAERGHLKLACRLLELGADVNAPPSPTGGRTALQAAASNGFTEIVRLLLERGADVNAAAAKYKGLTALQGACLQGEIGIVEVLLEAGADVHVLGGLYGDGMALHAAAEKGRLDVIKKLLESGADVNAISLRRGRGQTALQSAAVGGHDEAVDVLRSMGAVGGTGGGTFLFS